MLRTNRTQRPSEGLTGGQPEGLSQNRLFQAQEQESVALAPQTHLHLKVSPGDRIHHVVSGSGGYGDPLERDPDEVLADVKADKVTVHAARVQYGVVIDPQGGVDAAATTALRRQMGARV